MESLFRALKIDSGGIIAFAGAGGKTTLMYRMASELARSGDKILVTTTTKILPPHRNQPDFPVVVAPPDSFLRKAGNVPRRFNCMVAAERSCNGTGKLLGFDPAFIDELRESGHFRWILVEADGSARKPIKAPASHEPVIPAKCDFYFGMIGLGVLGKPFKDTYVHRPGHFQRVTGIGRGENISFSEMAALIKHGSGLFKNCPDRAKTIAFLNQADAVDTFGLGRQIIAQLINGRSRFPDFLVIGQAAGTPPIMELHPLNAGISKNRGM